MDDINQWLIKSDSNCLNVLHVCVAIEPEEFGHRCVDHLLLETDVDINCLAKFDGQIVTSAHIAIEWKRHKVLQLLINYGIDLFICDSYGQTIKEFAVKKDDQKAVSMIATALEEWKQITFSHTSSDVDKSYADNHIKSDQKLLNDEPRDQSDLEQTIIYFDDTLCMNSSDDSFKSNISYEKTDSIRSYGSDRTEVYVYNDKDHNVVLIEERYEVSPETTCSVPISNQSVVSRGCATANDSYRHLASIEAMNSTAIFNELRQWGDSSPPITPSTRKVCAKRLLRYRMGQLTPNRYPLSGYPDQLNLLIINRFPTDKAQQLDQQFQNLFETNGLRNKCFNYILRDPNIVDNIAFHANACLTDKSSEMKWFSKFVTSIFYVGKGQGDRMYEHFYESVKAEQLVKTSVSPKVNRILEIWRSGKGVISLPCFHSSSSEEAVAREAIMIEAIGIDNLTNVLNGTKLKQLRRNCFKNETNRRIYGSYLLYKAFRITLVSGERQIRPRL